MQRTFVLDYLRHGNATKAAKAAGYAHPGKAGAKLRSNRKIQDAIRDYFREQEMTAIEVVARLSQQARAEYAPYLRADGTVDLQQMIEDGKAHLIKRYGYSTTGNLTVEFYDAQTALIQVGRYHKIFTDGIEHHGAVPIQYIESVLSEELELNEDE